MSVGEPSSSATSRDVDRGVRQGSESDDNDGSAASSESTDEPVTFRCFSSGVSLSSSKHTSTIDLKSINEQRSRMWREEKKGQGPLRGGGEGNTDLEEGIAVEKERKHKKAEVAARVQAERHRAGRGDRPASDVRVPPPSAGATAKGSRVNDTTVAAPSSSSSREYVVIIRDFKFCPRHLEIEAGSRITWRVEEAMNMTEHCIEGTSDQPQLCFSSGLLQVRLSLPPWLLRSCRIIHGLLFT